MSQHLELGAVEGAVGDGDAKHVGVQLEIDAVHQPERLELVLGDFAREATLDLIAKLRNTCFYETLVELVIAVHADLPVASGCYCDLKFGLLAEIASVGRASGTNTLAKSNGAQGTTIQFNIDQSDVDHFVLEECGLAGASELFFGGFIKRDFRGLKRNGPGVIPGEPHSLAIGQTVRGQNFHRIVLSSRVSVLVR